ncbi:MAG TPA: ROK family protein [Chthoniobacteraceae bacterium]|jgi:predicted NBD/HSP70 family sugar kinase|nr:ROK family protein [Chthoniobacteraceae bacterium]
MDEIYVGLDIGGTKLIIASAEADGSIVARERSATPRHCGQGLELIDELIAKVARGRKIAGIGAAAGGPLDWRTGVVSPLHQPEWKEAPLKERLEKKWECGFQVDVDTNVAALGEYHYSSDHPARLLYLTVSTGMGGGLVVDGRIYRGMRGEHPEVGHQTINFRNSSGAPVVCSCGAGDCLEALISGNGIRRLYGKRPDELSQEQWEEVAWNFGQGLRNLAAIYLPEVIVLGGGIVFGAGDRFIERAVAIMRDQLKIVSAPLVRCSGMGEDNVLKGAFLLAGACK